MPRFLKYLSLFFAVLAVGAAQVVGSQLSYFCSCTGQRTVLESCEPSCHATTQDSPGCRESVGTEHHGEENHPADSNHQHEEVFEKLVGTPSPTILNLPVVIWVAVLTYPSFSTGAFTLSVPWPAVFDPGPPDGETLPDGVLVARTMVMLV